MDIVIFRNTASQGKLLGELLEKEGHNVTYVGFRQNKILNSNVTYFSQEKHYGLPFERSIRQLLFYLRNKFDLVIYNGHRSGDWVRADNIVYWHHGTQLISNPNLINNRGYHYVSSPDMEQYGSLLYRIVDQNLGSNVSQIAIPEGYDHIIGHFPSYRANKGSDFIDQAVANMIDIGHDIYYMNNYDGLIDREVFPSYLSACDFVIDQYVPDRGIIALNGLESMFLGTDVIASVREYGVEDKKLLKLVNNFYEEDGKLYFHLEKKNKTTMKSYVNRYHSGDATMSILSNDGHIY